MSRSIHRKLLLIVLATTFAGLALAAVSLVIYEAGAFRQARVNELASLASIIGQSSTAALQFDDPRAANENLALLRIRPNILAGAIYAENGTLFAAYAQKGPVPALLQEPQEGYRADGDTLILTAPILFQGRRIGAVYMRGMYGLNQRLLDYVPIIAGVMLMSLIAALLMSGWLRRNFTKPILDITAVAREVVEHRDFSLRARTRTEDELGYLVEAFNSMLGEIGRRSEALEESNRTLLEAEQALREADRRKDQFIAVLSHELRNPLSPIRNAVAVMRRSDIADPRLLWVRDVIERQSMQLARLLEDLMDVSRISRNRLELRRQKVLLSTIVDMATETSAPLLAANDQKLDVRLPATPIWLDADPARLAQVLANILNNAAKYTDRGGQVEIVGTLRAAQTQGAELLLAIRDNGIGIASHDLPGLFDMFSQASSNLARSHGGLGIGLALSRGLVELHGGRIEARSDGLGKGSQFLITLPVLAIESAPEQAPETRHVRTTDSLRVLIADDVVDAAQTLAEALTLDGYQVTTVYKGRDALRAALGDGEGASPDVAILDIGMPDLSGDKVAEHVRADPRGRAIVLIALTGWGQPQDVQRALNAGFDHHMTKPPDIEALGRLLAGIAEGRKGAAPESEPALRSARAGRT